MTDPWRSTRVLALEAFILHASTSIPFQDVVPHSPVITDAFAMAQEILQMEQEADNGYFHSPVLGAPPQVFTYVRQASLLYRQFQLEAADIEECSLLEEDLMQWTSEHFPTLFTADFQIKQATSTAASSVSSREEGNRDICLLESERTAEMLTFGPSLYLLTVRILLRYMLAVPFSQTDRCLSGLVSQAMDLVRCIDPSVDYFADLYCWPFLGLGVAVVKPEDRECLMELMMTYWNYLGSSTMKHVADVLTETWRHGEDWDQPTSLSNS